MTGSRDDTDELLQPAPSTPLPRSPTRQVSPPVSTRLPSPVLPSTGTPAAGWYPDPDDPGCMRRWDGGRWTPERIAPDAPTCSRTGADPEWLVDAIGCWGRFSGSAARLALLGVDPSAASTTSGAARLRAGGGGRWELAGTVEAYTQASTGWCSGELAAWTATVLEQRRPRSRRWVKRCTIASHPEPVFVLGDGEARVVVDASDVDPRVWVPCTVQEEYAPRRRISEFLLPVGTRLAVTGRMQHGSDGLRCLASQLTVTSPPGAGSRH